MLQEINRRQFLKQIGTACVAAVMAPAALVKAKEQPVYLIDCEAWKKERLIVKSVTFNQHIRLNGKKWKSYYIDFKPFATKVEREKYRSGFRKTLKNIKFKSPLMP